MVATQHVNIGERLAYTIPEAVSIIGLGRTILYAAIKDRSLKVKKYGKRTLVLRDDLIAFINGLPDGGPED